MIPPEDLNRSCVFLGARIVENEFRRRFGFRHLFINIYENPVNYAMIESLPLYSNIGWVSGAWVRENQWNTRGLSWEIVPED